MDAFFSFFQISSILKLIELELPDITQWFMGELNLFLTINLRIPFLQPLYYCEHAFINETNTYCQSYGYDKYNFIYNIQTDLVIFALTTFGIFIAIKIKNKLEGTINRFLLKLYDYCVNAFNERKNTLTEMYYQERMYLYVCMFHMLKAGTLNALDITGYVVVVIMACVDYRIMWRLVRKIIYSSKTLSIAICMNFESDRDSMATSVLQLYFLALQMLLPILLIFFSPASYMQSFGAAVLLMLGVVLLAKAKACDRKTKVNYIINYSALIGYCLITGVLAFMGNVSQEKVSGWTLNMLFLIPIVVSIIIFFITIAPVIKKSFQSMCQRCKDKSLRRVISIQ
jgi:hypothetical protein